MIAKIEGKLLALDGDSALVQVGQVSYEVMLPSYCVNVLADKIGADVVLCTKWNITKAHPPAAILYLEW
jgi:Holliday junction resolvasome RuvABC DNA-binding subunit